MSTFIPEQIIGSHAPELVTEILYYCAGTSNVPLTSPFLLLLRRADWEIKKQLTSINVCNARRSLLSSRRDFQSVGIAIADSYR